MPYKPPDGIARSAEVEQQLNETFALIFTTKPGEAVQRYLRSITVEMVSGPGQVDGQYLAHMEGQRYLVGIIEQRIAAGREKLPEVSRESTTEGREQGRRPGRRRKPGNG